MHNFNAGPSMLPEEVLREASAAILNFNNSGLSVLETAHRTRPIMDVMEEARALVKELMLLDDDHEVLFLHGGATTQFMQVPMNLLHKKDIAAYADTGVWSSKAIREAGYFGKVEVVCSSKDRSYRSIPKDFALPNDARYFHLTTNNTIYGTQWHQIPDVSVPLVADMSSDILSVQRNFNQFGLIYAGLQKNMGCAGASVVIVNRKWLDKIPVKISPIMDYRNHIREHSMLNTPPVFAVYVSMLTLRWLKAKGGISEIEKINQQKSDMLYAEIDRNSLFVNRVDVTDRSRMNVIFELTDEKLTSDFTQFTTERRIYGIAGHRSAGGFRASLYNALPLSSVEVLIEAMQDYEKRVQAK
ncbi:MAG: 3-phosphoserine/phosphohydroxythreonine transaminase [Ferruginibacter sp.]|nr:3-phosphoserine/phosphohydroxythreonine transaminase [Ferruginibacter sp.]